MIDSFDFHKAMRYPNCRKTFTITGKEVLHNGKDTTGIAAAGISRYS